MNATPKLNEAASGGSSPVPYSPSSTPDTDAAARWGSLQGYEIVDTDFARNLERERNEAREMARDMRNQLEKDSRARLIFPWENS